MSGTTAYDRSGNGYNGTINRATPTNGKVGQALDFNGSNASVASGAVFTDLGTSNHPYSFSVWVNVDEGESDGNIIHMVGGGWCLPPVQIDAGYFKGYSWPGGTTVVDTDPAEKGVWSHIVVTWDSANGQRIFVNGVLKNTTAQATYSASGNNNTIYAGYSPGGCAGNQGFFDGKIDEVRIYNRSLTPDEASRLYRLGR